ncbi:MAG: hypothetical protein K6A82_03260 [Prevotella sp.]|nr:hypothetical protein [Prevotella sp.]
MEKKHNQSRIISLVLLCIILTISIVASCHHSRAIEGSDGQDTVAAVEFEPQSTSGKIYIDLGAITSIHFPKYKVVKTTPFIPDSVSMAADEETVTNGNYSAMLLLDSIPSKEFYQTVMAAAEHDTCWDINRFAYTYIHKDKQGGKYKISFSKGGQQIFVIHINKDLLRENLRAN